MGNGASSQGPRDSTTPDPYTGLTWKQVSALRSTWNVFMKREQELHHGVRLLRRLFRKFPNYRRYFMEGPAIKMSELLRDENVQRHSNMIIVTMTTLLNVVSNAERLSKHLALLAFFHKDMGLEAQDFQNFFEIFITYMKSEFLDDIFEEASWREFSKFCIEVICERMVAFRLPENTDAKHVIDSFRRKEREYWDLRGKFWKAKSASWKEAEAHHRSFNIIEDSELDNLVARRPTSCWRGGASTATLCIYGSDDLLTALKQNGSGSPRNSDELTSAPKLAHNGKPHDGKEVHAPAHHNGAHGKSVQEIHTILKRTKTSPTSSHADAKNLLPGGSRSVRRNTVPGVHSDKDSESATTVESADQPTRRGVHFNENLVTDVFRSSLNELPTEQDELVSPWCWTVPRVRRRRWKEMLDCDDTTTCCALLRKKKKGVNMHGGSTGLLVQKQSQKPDRHFRGSTLNIVSTPDPPDP